MMHRIKALKALLFFISPLIFFPQLSFPDQRIEIYKLRHHTHPTFTRIVVDIGTLREYTPGELSSPDRIYVDIYQVKLNPLLHGKTVLIKNNYLKQIRIAQKSYSTVRVVIDIDFTKIKRYHVFHLFNPFRVVIDIYPNESKLNNTPSSQLPKPPQPTKSGYSMIRQLGLGIQKVIIDPGHGGTDPGCIGKRGAQEKDIVLDVSRRLKKLLESQEDLNVILTRETDIFLPLEDRPVVANQKHADIFISIHANANRNKKRSGIETFYLNFNKDPSVIETAARENATSTKNISEMKGIISKIVRNSKIDESIDLAEKIQKNLVRHLSKKYSNIKDLDVKGGPFWVLIGGEMPSVLVEISYLSNLREESRLKTPLYRQRIAQGIYEGIMEYIYSLGKG